MVLTYLDAVQTLQKWKFQVAVGLALPQSEQIISRVSALWITIIPEQEKYNSTSTSSYLVELLQLANDTYTEEEFMYTTYAASAVRVLLSDPCGLPLSHASQPKHAQCFTCKKGRTAAVCTWIS